MKNTGKFLTKQGIPAYAGIVRTFGRIHGKKLSMRQQWLVDNLLPNLNPQPSTINPILEIGFGAGEHLRELATKNPDKIIIGCEPFVNGVASLLSAITDENNNVKPEYKNIRIFPDDVRKLLATDDRRLSTIYILHPDPWPKARHEKRRLLSADFLNLLADHLVAGGQIIIGTDHYGYYDWILDQIKKTRLCQGSGGQAVISTRYQKKNKANTSSPKYLTLYKKS